MERLLSYRGVGIRITGAADLVDLLDGDLPAFYLRGEAPDAPVEVEVAHGERGPEVTLEGQPCWHGGSLRDALRFAASRIELELVSRFTDVAVLHAGVVVHGGRALVLPGTSHAGKSTLVQALLRAGADYASDEYALIDRSGVVHPYPRRLTIRRELGAWDRVDPAALGARTAVASPVGLVAALRWGPPAAVTPLEGGGLVLRLIEDCVNVRQAPATVLDVLSRLAERPAVAGNRGEAGETAHDLLLRLG